MATELTPLTAEEDTFCLGIIEYSGNMGAAWRAAYGDDKYASAKARLALTRPEIALRIQQLTKVVQEHAYITLGSHLQELADIRDISKATNQMKTALAAEIARGKVAGFYDKPEEKDPEGKPAVHIHLPAGSSVSVQQWAAKNSPHAPIVIDNDSGKVVDRSMTVDNDVQKA